MPDENQRMRLWIAPDEHLAGGVIEPGSDVILSIGVEPADASNRVQVTYRVNGGPESQTAAEPVRHVGKAQYFQVRLPSSSLIDGDTMEYRAVCQCAGRQVSSGIGDRPYAASFRVIGPAATHRHDTSDFTRQHVIPAAAGSVHMDTWNQAASRGTTARTPKHLSLFVLDQHTGHPISRMPFFAEVEVVSQAPKPECKIKDVITQLIHQVVTPTRGYRDNPTLEMGRAPSLTEAVVVEALCDALSRLLALEVLDRMAGDLAYATAIFNAVVKHFVSPFTNPNEFDPNDPQPALSKALEVAVRGAALELQLPLAVGGGQQPMAWLHPLGVLATDHVGYLSFDLTRLPTDVADAVDVALEARRRDPDAVTGTSIWLYPMARDADKIDALGQGRFAHDAIVVKLELKRPVLPSDVDNLGILAMQNPDLTDWRLSPASFATNPGALVGEDGCETLLPAHVALQEQYFYQVIRLTDVPPPVAPVTPRQLQLGIVNEYRIAWVPLGHSLGQIIYSMPLAPGESVNLAVIDWTRRDEAQRKERTTVDEQLVHNEHRDRTITEAVDTAVSEYQHGSNFTGGISGGLGGSSSSGSGGIAGSLGGSTSSTSGNRTVTGTTVQKLSDNIAQVSSSMRELQSTVVVQSTQSEKEAIETRTIVNYNHSHALTILYYEVLRHFRVVTELVRQRPAVLVRFRTDWFENSNGNALNAARENILGNRAVLAAALLDSRFAGGFDALDRVSRGPFADFNNQLPVAPPPPSGPRPTPPPFFHYFTFEMRAGNFIRDVLDDDQRADILADLLLVDGRQISLRNNENSTTLNYDGSFRIENQNNVFTAVPEGNGAIAWADIRGLVLLVVVQKTDDSEAKVSFSHIKVSGIDEFGPPGIALVDESHEDGHIIIRNFNKEQGRKLTLPTRRPPVPPAPAPLFSPADASDRAQSLALIAHLNAHKRFYSRSIALAQNAYERLNELDSIQLVDTSTALEHLENRPLEVVGDYLAYPGTDIAWNQLILSKIQQESEAAAPADVSERLVTLPTRGVFAEAKLGHCNASERIDNTRFWDWQQSPIPHFAPEIAPAVPVTPQPQQANLAATPFPNSIVNIVNPPNAPDPTGLASAFKVLGTPNLFRDLSGAQEVAQLLQTLANEAAVFAKGGAGAGAAAGGIKPGGGTGTGTGAGSGTPGGGTPSSSPATGATTARSGAPANVGEVNQLAAGIRSQLPPNEADPLVGQLYQNAVQKAGADTSGVITDPAQITGQFFLASSGGSFPTGPDHQCFPVSLFQTSDFASGFGTVAERLIEEDYCATFACSPAITYKDNNNPTQYRQFMEAHNPSLTVPPLSTQLSAAFPAVSRPDIMCDDGVRKDYYEIKPFSISGVAAALAKRASINSFMNDFKLPYVAGTAYTPSKDIPLMWGSMLGSNIGVSLNVQRHIEGIVTYTICLTGEVVQLLYKATLAAILAYIAAVLLPLLLAPAVVA